MGVYWVAALDMQKRHVLHIHALLTGVRKARRLSYLDKWLKMGGKNGYARIYPVEKSEAVSRYVCKYVTKNGSVELSGNLPDVTSGLAEKWGGSSSQRTLT